MTTTTVCNSLVHLRDLLSTYDINSELSTSPLISALDAVAHDLTRKLQKRTELGSDPSLWPELRRLWKDLARAHLSFWDDSETDEAEDQSKRQLHLRNLSISVARFTRNLVAGVPDNQVQAFDNEPEIRRLLHYYTSWSAAEDKQTLPLLWMLTQTLSNLVTANEGLITRLWELYLSQPEDQEILLRLLSFPDNKTILITLVFIMNCIRGSKRRLIFLCRTAIGSRLCIAILDLMVRLFDATELSDGAQAFNIGYAIFSQLIEQGYVSDLYSKFSMRDEPVTPHQTTLLKIVDSYLHSKKRESNAMLEIHTMLSPLLAKTFFSSSAYAQTAIRRSLGSSPSDTLPRELDTKLPQVCEALVLLTQCMVTISLEAEERKFLGSNTQSYTDLKEYFNQQRHEMQGIVEILVELLRLLDAFLPRINFGKPVSSAPMSEQKTFDQAHDPTGFSYLKRDLVRLLGILSHKERSVQDRVRDCGGIPVVMNLCVIDERNPYLKEHAILALHNLLENNVENQKLVESIKPIN